MEISMISPALFVHSVMRIGFSLIVGMVGHLALKLALLQYVNTIITSSQQHLLEKLGGQKSTVECS